MASFVSLSLLAFFIVLIKVPVDQIEKSIRAREIRAAVHQRIFRDVRAAEHSLFEDSWGERIVASIDTRGAIIWRIDPSVIPVIDILAALDAGDIPALRAGLLSPDFFPQGNVPDEVRRLSDAMAELDSNRRDMIEARNNARRIVPKFVAARENLRLFLGFPPEAIGPDQFEEGDSEQESDEAAGSAEEFPVYASGVLADLPELREIPGDYKDLPDLRRSLDAFDVHVKVSGPNPMQDFQDTIADLREKFASARAEIAALKEQDEKLSTRRVQIEQQVEESRNSVRKLYESRLNVLLSPPGLLERINKLTIQAA